MNIVLIGMPGCGKSTVGVLLAKSMLFDFTDTDLIIQNTYNTPLCEIINKYGIDEFKKIENEVLYKIKTDNCVIATGGSAVYGEDAMANLKSGGITVYLKLSPNEIKRRINNIKTRGIVMQKGETLEQLYEKRAPLYEKYADITINCENLTAEECVNKITEQVASYGKA